MMAALSQKKTSNGRTKSADGQSVNPGRAAYRRYTLIAVATIPTERAGIIELWSMPGKRIFQGMGIHSTLNRPR
jgi:hypothetical protein